MDDQAVNKAINNKIVSVTVKHEDINRDNFATNEEFEPERLENEPPIFDDMSIPINSSIPILEEHSTLATLMDDFLVGNSDSEEDLEQDQPCKLPIRLPTSNVDNIADIENNENSNQDLTLNEAELEEETELLVEVPTSCNSGKEDCISEEKLEEQNETMTYEQETQILANNYEVNSKYTDGVEDDATTVAKPDAGDEIPPAANINATKKELDDYFFSVNEKLDENFEISEKKKQKKKPKSVGKRSEALQTSSEVDDLTFDSNRVVFGTWVECVKCEKWRFLPDVNEPHLLPEDWNCQMSSTEADACNVPEAEQAQDEQLTKLCIENEYTMGSLVWAQVDGYPSWPAIIDKDPDYKAFFELEEDTERVESYHCIFMDRLFSRAWVKSNRIEAFKGSEGNTRNGGGRNGSGKTAFLLQQAIVETEKALKCSIEERLQKWGFEVRYDGKAITNKWTKKAASKVTKMSKKNRNKERRRSETLSKAGESSHAEAKIRKKKCSRAAVGQQQRANLSVDSSLEGIEFEDMSTPVSDRKHRKKMLISSDEEEEKTLTKKKKNTAGRKDKAKRKISLSMMMSKVLSSSSDDDEEPAAKNAKKKDKKIVDSSDDDAEAAAKSAKKKGKKFVDSSDDEEPVAKSAKKKGKKIVDSSDDEEPVAKSAKKKGKKFVESSSDDEEAASKSASDEEEEGDVVAKAKKAATAAPKKPGFLGSMLKRICKKKTSLPIAPVPFCVPTVMKVKAESTSQPPASCSMPVEN